MKTETLPGAQRSLCVCNDCAALLNTAECGELIDEESRTLTRHIAFKDGGCLPGCDHGAPPDIAWPDFVKYTRLLAQLTGSL